MRSAQPHDQTASWVTAICLAMALETAWLSWRTRMPIITAWSTPGAALVAVSSGFTMSDAVGAFIIVALLLILTGVLKPLTRLISRIPASVASGMLAGIVVSFAINAVKTVTVDPVLILPLIAVFFLIRLFNPALSVLAVLIGGGVAAFLLGRVGGLPLAGTVDARSGHPNLFIVGRRRSGAPALPRHHGVAEPVRPRRPEGCRLPARAWADHYAAPASFRLISAPFGALTTNLAAISAAICTGPDVHPDPAERWKTGPFYALAYLIFAIFGASLVAIFAALPPSLIVLVAGLALMAPLANALSIALKDEPERMAATTTFAVTASGLDAVRGGLRFLGPGRRPCGARPRLDQEIRAGSEGVQKIIVDSGSCPVLAGPVLNSHFAVPISIQAAANGCPQLKEREKMNTTALIRPAWTPATIALMVLGFVVFWPLGLAMLAYILWGDRLDGFKRDVNLKTDGIFASCRGRHARHHGFGRTGNIAFDDWREKELERLSEERRKLDEMLKEFDSYARELRRAKDQEEFDRFMANRDRAKNEANDKPRGSSTPGLLDDA